MARFDKLLALYAELASTVARMVELGRARRWAALPALDARCTDLVTELRGIDARGLNPLQCSRVMALGARIRADQHELKRLVQPQFIRLTHRIAELQQAS
jgi:flagellar protein FliT